MFQTSKKSTPTEARLDLDRFMTLMISDLSVVTEMDCHEVKKASEEAGLVFVLFLAQLSMKPLNIRSCIARPQRPLNIIIGLRNTTPTFDPLPSEQMKFQMFSF